METDKLRIQPLLDPDTYNKLEEMAKESGAKIGPYAASVLKRHVENKPKPFTSKHEYKDEMPKAIYTDKQGNQHPR